MKTWSEFSPFETYAESQSGSAMLSANQSAEVPVPTVGADGRPIRVWEPPRAQKVILAGPGVSTKDDLVGTNLGLVIFYTVCFLAVGALIPVIIAFALMLGAIKANGGGRRLRRW